MSASPPRPEVVLVTGGGSGIGRGLAAAFHARGAKVIVAGRSRARLEAVASAHPGLEVEEVDVADPVAVAACAGRVAARHPGLDVVINNAGVQRLLDFAADPPPGPEAFGEELDVNLRGLIAVTSAFLPLLRQRPGSRLVQVGSGLGYVPLASAPVYSATKAAVHSFTVSLRRQLAGGPVQVVALVPPVVETELHRGQPRKPPGAMKLEDFVTAAMAGLDARREEIVVGRARALRVGSRVAPGFFLGVVNPASRAS